jgi:hypothetical protein
MRLCFLSFFKLHAEWPCSGAETIRLRATSSYFCSTHFVLPYSSKDFHTRVTSQTENIRAQKIIGNSMDSNFVWINITLAVSSRQVLTSTKILKLSNPFAFSWFCSLVSHFFF